MQQWHDDSGLLHAVPSMHGGACACELTLWLQGRSASCERFLGITSDGNVDLCDASQTVICQVSFIQVTICPSVPALHEVSVHNDELVRASPESVAHLDRCDKAAHI